MSTHPQRLLTLCLLVLLLGSRALTAAPVLDPSHVREHTLANGLHVVVKEERGWGTVALGAYVRCGSLHDPSDLPGMAHFVEHMLFRTGEESGEPSELISAIEGRGGQINAETNRDSTVVHVVTSPQSLTTVWPLLARTLLEAEFDEDAIREEKKIISQEIAEREGQAFNALADVVWSAAYATHPYGRSIGGTRETVAEVNGPKLTEFYRRFYVPNNIALVLVGDVKAEEVFAQAQEAFGTYPQRPVEWAAPQVGASLDTSKTDTQTRDVSMTLIGLGFRGPGIAKKLDVCAMDIIYTVLSEGRHSWLAREVEEPGLVAAYDFQFITQKDDGLVLVTAAAEPAKELDARAAIADQFRRLAAEGLAEEELERTKRLLRNSYAFANEAYSDQVGSIGFYEMIDTYRFAFDYVDAVNQVTSDDVKRVAAQYLDTDKHVLVIFRPPAPRKPGGEV